MEIASRADNTANKMSSYKILIWKATVTVLGLSFHRPLVAA
jgi:hypothetical protein